MNASYTLRSSISKTFKDDALKKGGLLGGLGALFLILSGTFLPLSVLERWGLPLLLVGLVLITLGMRPYRQLCQLEIHPHKLVFEAEGLTFYDKGRKALHIAAPSLEKMCWKSYDVGYGLWIKVKNKEAITVLNPRFDLAHYLSFCQIDCLEYDLFLPFFSQASTKEFGLQTGLDQIMHF
jgi:hypothetical protein